MMIMIMIGGRTQSITNASIRNNSSRRLRLALPMRLQPSFTTTSCCSSSAVGSHILKRKRSSAASSVFRSSSSAVLYNSNMMYNAATNNYCSIHLRTIPIVVQQQQQRRPYTDDLQVAENERFVHRSSKKDQTKLQNVLLRRKPTTNSTADAVSDPAEVMKSSSDPTMREKEVATFQRSIAAVKTLLLYNTDSKKYRKSSSIAEESTKTWQQKKIKHSRKFWLNSRELMAYKMAMRTFMNCCNGSGVSAALSQKQRIDVVHLVLESITKCIHSIVYLQNQGRSKRRHVRNDTSSNHVDDFLPSMRKWVYQPHLLYRFYKFYGETSARQIKEQSQPVSPTATSTAAILPTGHEMVLKLQNLTTDLQSIGNEATTSNCNLISSESIKLFLNYIMNEHTAAVDSARMNSTAASSDEASSKSNNFTDTIEAIIENMKRQADENDSDDTNADIYYVLLRAYTMNKHDIATIHKIDEVFAMMVTDKCYPNTKCYHLYFEYLANVVANDAKDGPANTENVPEIVLDRLQYQLQIHRHNKDKNVVCGLLEGSRKYQGSRRRTRVALRLKKKHEQQQSSVAIEATPSSLTSVDVVLLASILSIYNSIAVSLQKAKQNATATLNTKDEAEAMENTITPGGVRIIQKEILQRIMMMQLKLNRLDTADTRNENVKRYKESIVSCLRCCLQLVQRHQAEILQQTNAAGAADELQEQRRRMVWVIETAEYFLTQARTHGSISENDSFDQSTKLLQEIYEIVVHQHFDTNDDDDVLETILKQIASKDSYKCAIMIRALGACGHPQTATDLLHRVLASKLVRPNMPLFQAAMNAWSVETDSHLTHEERLAGGLRVLELCRTHPKCTALNAAELEQPHGTLSPNSENAYHSNDSSSSSSSDEVPSNASSRTEDEEADVDAHDSEVFRTGVSFSDYVNSVADTSLSDPSDDEWRTQ